MENIVLKEMNTISKCNELAHYERRCTTNRKDNSHDVNPKQQQLQHKTQEEEKHEQSFIVAIK